MHYGPPIKLIKTRIELISVESGDTLNRMPVRECWVAEEGIPRGREREIERESKIKFINAHYNAYTSQHSKGWGAEYRSLMEGVGSTIG